ncbi:MAG: monoheme cytochrome SoxX [Pseudomonadota bacterium]
MFGRRLILLATPRHVGVLDWRPGRMHWLGKFGASEADLADFRRVVESHAHLPALIVVDTVDEDYRSEILPHVQGQARAELLNRKLKQVFRNARFVGAWRQARETAGRRDDRYLFAALTDADWLTPWLTVLHRANAPLYGITPLAVASQYLLARLRVQEAHTLLAHRLDNRLRLSYYQNGLLRFSRLVSSESPTQQPGNAADEIAKTQLYLTGQRILPREARLHVLLLDPSGQLDAAQAQLNADPAFNTRLIGLADLGRALRIPEDFLAATPEIVPLAAIASETLPLNLAPPELLQHYSEFRWRHGLRTLAGGVAALGLVVTAINWLHAQDLQRQAQALALEQQQLDARYRAIARTFPADVATPEQLAQTVQLAHTLETTQMPDVEALYGAVGQALAAYPDFRLEALAWRSETTPTAEGADIRLDASLVDFDGNYRAAMQRIERFMQDLAAMPNLRGVRLRVSPVNAGPGGTLTGRIRTPDAASADAVGFSLEFRFRESGP